jgi:hypothetical protein
VSTLQVLTDSLLSFSSDQLKHSAHIRAQPGNSVSIVTRLMAGRPFPAEAGIFLFATASRPALGPVKPPIQLSAGVTWSGREFDHLPPSNDDFKKPWSYTSTPLYVFITFFTYLGKGRASFPFVTGMFFLTQIPGSTVYDMTTINIHAD